MEVERQIAVDRWPSFHVRLYECSYIWACVYAVAVGLYIIICASEKARVCPATADADADTAIMLLLRVGVRLRRRPDAPRRMRKCTRLPSARFIWLARGEGAMCGGRTNKARARQGPDVGVVDYGIIAVYGG